MLSAEGATSINDLNLIGQKAILTIVTFQYKVGTIVQQIKTAYI